MAINCKNCDSVTQGNYCNNCGQRTSINKVTFKETFQDFIDTIFSINSPLALTLKLLIINPGKLFREYLNGKRKTYYKPVPFFILMTIIFVIIKALLNYDPMEGLAVIESTNINQSLINNAGIFMAKNTNNIIFIFVFTFSLLVKLFFFKKNTFAEYVAISFYVIGFYITVTAVLMFGLQYLDRQYNMTPLVFMFFYVIYALVSFFQKKSILTIVKIISAYYISLMLYIILGYGLSFLIVWLKTL